MVWFKRGIWRSGEDLAFLLFKVCLYRQRGNTEIAANVRWNRNMRYF
jgi:hypothetical protein